MKSKKSFDKLRGGYYTPQAITEFICKWIINKNTKNILEPSCGDGNFLKAIVERQEKLNLNLDITGVELCLDEAKKAMRYGTNVECQDFFAFYRDKVTGKSNYDAIVGNPPFIRYQDFDEKSRDIAFFYMKENGFHPTKLTNIWLPFLILSCLALSENGRLGMVIPAELFQVNYAGETREFLARYFDRLTLITFQKLVFEEIQQEVILLLGEKKSEDKGIQVIELSDLDDLKELDLNNFYNYEIKELNHSTEKWIKYYLTNKEIKLIRQAHLHVQVQQVFIRKAYDVLTNHRFIKEKLSKGESLDSDMNVQEPVNVIYQTIISVKSLCFSSIVISTDALAYIILGHEEKNTMTFLSD